jgi:hypothetical protein
VRVRCLLVACAVAGQLTCFAMPVSAADNVSPGSPQGNVTPALHAATGVAVVAQSAPVDGRVALLLRNATAKPVRIDLVTATATGADGGTATRARTVKTYPQVLAPDGLALSSVVFRTKELAPGATISAKVRSRPVSNARATRVLSVGDLALSPPGTGTVAQTMSATLRNATSAWVAKLPATAVMCFGEAGTPTTFTATRASTRRIGPGKTASTSVPLTLLCPTYLVAARAS